MTITLRHWQAAYEPKNITCTFYALVEYSELVCSLDTCSVQLHGKTTLNIGVESLPP